MKPAASGSGKPVGHVRPFQGKNRPLKPSLEAVHRTEDDLVAVRGGAFLAGLFKLFLRVAGHGVDGSTLAERIVVARGHRPAREVNVVLVVHVAVGDLALERAAGHRVVHAEARAPAVDKAVAFIVREALNAVESNAAALSRIEFLILEVLIEGHELQAAVELIVAAHRDRKAVVGMLFLTLTLVAVQGGIRDEDAFETGVLVAKGQRGIAVSARLAFNLVRIRRRIRLERIHGVAGDAREGRGDIAQGVVDAGPLGGACKAGAEADGVVRKERVNRAEEAVGAENAAEDRKHAGAQRAVRAVEVDVRFTAEKAAALIERAVVRLEARFEHKYITNERMHIKRMSVRALSPPVDLISP